MASGLLVAGPASAVPNGVAGEGGIAGPVAAVGQEVAAASVAVEAERDEVGTVKYRSADNIYLDVGSTDGITVGQRLVVVRDGVEIATLEVMFVALHSAACRLVEEKATVEPADTVWSVTAATGGVRPIANKEPAAAQPDVPGTSSPSSAGDSGAAALIPNPPQERRAAPWARPSGTVSVGWERFIDGTDAGRDLDILSSQANLRLREIGGAPYVLSLRTRTHRLERAGPLLGSGAVPASETRNRLYELSLAYDPPQGRFGYRVGRIGFDRWVGSGSLDGVVAGYRVSDTVEAGGFVGTVPHVTGFDFGLQDRKYGAFARVASDGRWAGRYFDLVVAGIREELGDTSRDYARFEASFGSGRWSLFQRSELDFNRPSADAPGGRAGLANLSFTGTYRFSTRGRIRVSYDMHRDSFGGAVRIDDLYFEDRFRSYLRTAVSFAVGPDVNVTVNGSMRFREKDQDPVYSVGAGAWSRLGMVSISTDVRVFANGVTRGFIASAGLSRTFADRYRLSGSYTNITVDGDFLGGRRTNHRGSMFAWIELPVGLFIRAGLEISSGRDLDGRRGSLELGYRF